MGLAAPSPWLPCLSTTIIFTFALATITAYYILGYKWRPLQLKVRQLEASLKASLDKCASERQGRIRAQRDLRKALLQKEANNLEATFYPMMPIGTIQSCFWTRNGTPRQPLLVPLARACLDFDPVRVPPASLEGLQEYSHVWIIYVFHLNTDLDKLWLEPSRSKIKAKVRVPRLKGGKKGVYATRSPHRPCPIGLTVAKVEAVQGHMILLSGVDLVDGTPVLDVKPYLPYCDSIQESVVPEWVKEDSLLAIASITFYEGFDSALADCWRLVEKSSLYTSPSELKNLIKQVLSWDIRSSAQRHRPHTVANSELADNSQNGEVYEGEEAIDPLRESSDSNLVVYHLNLEGLDISYVIDFNGNVLIEGVSPVTSSKNNQNRCSYGIWKDKLG